MGVISLIQPVKPELLSTPIVMFMAKLLACFIGLALALQLILQRWSQSASHGLIQIVGALGFAYAFIAVGMVVTLSISSVRQIWFAWLFGILVIIGLAIWNLKLFHSMSGAV